MPQITFTRFIAAMAIVFFHFARNFTPFNSWPLNLFIGVAPVGVSYFFVLSGFIMAFVYFHDDDSQVDKRRYYIARFARIYPLYLLALLIVLLWKVLFEQGAIGFWALASHLLMLQAWIPQFTSLLNGPAWSLSAEMLFYLLFPFIVGFIKKNRTSWKLAVLAAVFWILGTGVNLYLMNNFNWKSDAIVHHFINYNPLFHLHTFILGLWGGVFLKRANPPRRGFTSTALIIVPIAVVSYVIVTDNPIINYYHNGIFAPLFLMILLGLAYNRSWIAKVLSCRPLVLLGEISYCIYIIQVPFHIWFIKITPYLPRYDLIYYFYLYVTLLILSSYVLFNYIEKPLREFIKRRLGNESLQSTDA